MPQEPLDLCGISPNDFVSDDENRNSFLYNAMIHPLVRMSIKGVLWYQGSCAQFDREESNESVEDGDGTFAG